jgi:hypothetical protein
VSLTRLPPIVSSTSDSLFGMVIARVAAMTGGGARDVRLVLRVEKCWKDHAARVRLASPTTERGNNG